MGYVGIPVACEFASKGMSVTGLDVDEGKVKKINSGIYPFTGNEPEISGLLAMLAKEGKFSATTSPDAVKSADTVLVCVQTPFDSEKREPDYGPLKSAIETIGKNLKKGSLVVVESTIAPGTMEGIVLPALEKSSRMKAGKDFFLAHCPERVTPGKLFLHLRTMDRMVGGAGKKSTDAAMEFYKGITSGKLHPMDMRMAELVKTTENAYRDMEIGFANQMALACQSLSLDVHELRKYVNTCPDRNMHEPGIGVGGHCIPKDPLLLVYGMKGKCSLPITEESRKINEGMPKEGAEIIRKMLEKNGIRIKGARIALLGIAYLANSDDTRNSPGIALAKELSGMGASVVAFDPCARQGAPGIEMAESLEEAINCADCLALTVAHKDFLPLASVEGLRKIAGKMRARIIFDGRNAFDSQACRNAGFSFCGIGKEFIVQ